MKIGYDIWLSERLQYSKEKQLQRDRWEALEQTLEQLSWEQPPNSLHIERVQNCKERWYSARVDIKYRLIFYQEGNQRIAVWVDEHDPAYAWAKEHFFHKNDYGEHYIRRDPETLPSEVPPEPEPPAESYPLVGYDCSDLQKLDVPKELCDHIRNLSAEALVGALCRLLEEGYINSETAERILALATGTPLKELLPPAQLRDKFDLLLEKGNLSRFWKPKDTDELKRAILQPWETWLVFLSPTQREVAEQHYNGPARVSGAAGTGKTVVALHRTKHLLERYPGSRIFLTTYTVNMARELERRMKLLIGESLPPELYILNLDKFVNQEFQKLRTGATLIYRDEELKQKTDFAQLCQTYAPRFSPDFVWSEWQWVINAWNIQSWEAYRDFERIGRGSKLSEEQREQLWQVFDAMRKKLRQAMLLTPEMACYMLAEHYRNRGAPFRCVVADETQDFGPAQMTLLKSLAPADQPDNLFFCIDTAQRIYQRSLSWKRLGIEVRGRSKTLRINYRNTLEIQEKAEKVLAGCNYSLRDEEDIEAVVRGVRALTLLSGNKPEVRHCENFQREVAALREWLLRCQREFNMDGNKIAILARTKDYIEKQVVPVLNELGISYCWLGDERLAEPHEVYLGAVHSSKGLEFRAVAIVGASRDMFPFRPAVGRAGDPEEQPLVEEQERQLLYTAITRAREQLFISWVLYPSPFLPRD
ncbi:UvrD/REP helicase N-terminal domain-containing protein [Armatimonadetes bacterium DC]|nr:UvrD/REP helicase N-terminal domain-containing protein [Armatimonadetes bacterium DC]